MTAVNWTHRVSEIGERPLDAEREALPSELPAVARDLDVPACEALEAAYTIRPIGRGRYMLAGKAEARLIQTCVVTLDPVTSNVREDFEIELWPQEDLPAARGEAIDAFGPDDPEAIENGIIDVGRIVIECIASAVDRYPRKPDAVFSWADDKEAPESDNPFAKLKNLGRGN